MAEIARSIRYEQAEKELDTFLANFHSSVRRLSSEEITEQYEYSIAGWRLCVECTEGQQYLDYLIDQNFPYSIPRIALPNYEEGTRWPHLFDGNYLCLLPNTAEVDSNSPISVFEYLVNEAHSLIEKCSSGELDEDFAEEFLSYWAFSVTEPDKPIFSLLDPSGPTRHIELVEGTNSFVACQNHVEGQNWLVNQHGKKLKNAPWRKALLVWLGAPPSLKGFSRANHSLLSWLDELDAAANKKVKKALKKTRCMIVFGFDVGYGAAFAAVEVMPKKVKNKSKSRRQAIQASLTDNEQTKLFEVKRVDHGWVHGRGQDRRAQVLKTKEVVMIGCGSVGGSVARLLAEAGVGLIHCIDPDIMEWSNVGRHILGSESVNQIKSDRLASQLQSQFPHLNLESYGPLNWQNVFGSGSKVFDEADLIVSTTGSWESDAQLNELAISNKNILPVLFGWTEAHAAAGHAVLIPNASACLACNFDNTGLHSRQAVDWTNINTLQREPACGTFFQPFGPIELSFINGLLADVALSALLETPDEPVVATWLAPNRKIAELGGKWGKEWVKKYGDPDRGGFRTEHAWKPRENCPVCGRK